jgi:hypothetical protein
MFGLSKQEENSVRDAWNVADELPKKTAASQCAEPLLEMRPSCSKKHEGITIQVGSTDVGYLIVTVRVPLAGSVELQLLPIPLSE